MRHRFHFTLAVLLLALTLGACNRHDNTPSANGSNAASAPMAQPATDNANPPGASATDIGTPVALPSDPRVTLHTNMGDIVIELYPDKAPKTVENFLTYAHEGFYNGTIFNRVIDDLLIQGGGYTVDLQKKPTHPPIPDEANNGLSNQRGTIAAAHGLVPASATSEFFINLVDNPRFDYISDADATTAGYAVFGKVVSGMDVIDKIRLLKTQPQGKFTSDVPVTPVVIDRVEILPPAPAATTPSEKGSE